MYTIGSQLQYYYEANKYMFLTICAYLYNNQCVGN